MYYLQFQKKNSTWEIRFPIIVKKRDELKILKKKIETKIFNLPHNETPVYQSIIIMIPRTQKD